MLTTFGQCVLVAQILQNRTTLSIYLVQLMQMNCLWHWVYSLPFSQLMIPGGALKRQSNISLIYIFLVFRNLKEWVAERRRDICWKALCKSLKLNPNQHESDFVLYQDTSICSGGSPRVDFLGNHHHRRGVVLHRPSTGQEMPLHMGLWWRGASTSAHPRGRAHKVDFWVSSTLE